MSPRIPLCMPQVGPLDPGGGNVRTPSQILIVLHGVTQENSGTPSGGFLKWGYPEIMHLNRIFHYKPSSYWGTPFMETPKWPFVVRAVWGSQLFTLNPAFQRVAESVTHERCSKGLVYFVVFYETHMVRTRKSFRGANSWSFRCIWEVYKIKTTCDTCIYIDMIYRYLKSANYPLSRSFRDGVCPFGLRQAFAQLSRTLLTCQCSESSLEFSWVNMNWNMGH